MQRGKLKCVPSLQWWKRTLILYIKEVYDAHFQIHDVILGYYSNSFTCISAQKYICFLILPVQHLCIPPLSESPVSLRPAS